MCCLLLAACACAVAVVVGAGAGAAGAGAAIVVLLLGCAVPPSNTPHRSRQSMSAGVFGRRELWLEQVGGV